MAALSYDNATHKCRNSDSNCFSIGNPDSPLKKGSQRTPIDGVPQNEPSHYCCTCLICGNFTIDVTELVAIVLDGNMLSFRVVKIRGKGESNSQWIAF